MYVQKKRYCTNSDARLIHHAIDARYNNNDNNMVSLKKRLCGLQMDLDIFLDGGWGCEGAG